MPQSSPYFFSVGTGPTERAKALEIFTPLAALPIPFPPFTTSQFRSATRHPTPLRMHAIDGPHCAGQATDQKKQPVPDKNAIEIPDKMKREAERPRQQQHYTPPAPPNQDL